MPKQDDTIVNSGKLSSSITLLSLYLFRYFRGSDSLNSSSSVSIGSGHHQARNLWKKPTYSWLGVMRPGVRL